MTGTAAVAMMGAARVAEVLGGVLHDICGCRAICFAAGGVLHGMTLTLKFRVGCCAAYLVCLVVTVCVLCSCVLPTYAAAVALDPN